VNVVKSNNDKYIQKIVNLDTNVNQVLTDSSTLLNEWRKKVESVQTNSDQIKNYKNELSYHMKQLQDGLKS